MMEPKLVTGFSDSSWLNKIFIFYFPRIARDRELPTMGLSGCVPGRHLGQLNLHLGHSMSSLISSSAASIYHNHITGSVVWRRALISY